MSDKAERKHLADDSDHLGACTKRWTRKLNRDMDDPSYRDEWRAQQCLFCRFFIPLVGAFIEDWGVCSNERSPCDGRAMFEHDGCEHHEEGDQFWTTSGAKDSDD